jgi:hypothetical protein
MERLRTEPRARARDAGIARLKRATRITIFGATALAGAFAALAAHSAPGHKAATTVTSARRTAKQTQAAISPGTATQAQSDDQTQVQSQAATPAVAPQPTYVAPQPTYVAPVAVTGGS